MVDVDSGPVSSLYLSSLKLKTNRQNNGIARGKACLVASQRYSVQPHTKGLVDDDDIKEPSKQLVGIEKTFHHWFWAIISAQGFWGRRASEDPSGSKCFASFTSPMGSQRSSI